MIRIGKYMIFNEDTYNIKLKIVNDKGKTLFYDKYKLEKIFDEFFKKNGVEIQDTASGLRIKFLEKAEIDDKLPVYHVINESMNFYTENISEEVNKAAYTLLKLYKSVKEDEAKKEQYGYEGKGL